MPPEAQEKIRDVFSRRESFSQYDGRLGRRYEGVGLGLTYVGKVAELHDAALEVKSEAGKGTRIRLIFHPRPDRQEPGGRMKTGRPIALGLALTAAACAHAPGPAIVAAAPVARRHRAARAAGGAGTRTRDGSGHRRNGAAQPESAWL